ncbi:hypothetical protein MIR68_005115 [Amoeboaphelidium protococcarum]|nr:hypothetical protein MIR68_005115 [Amoeboaphelidium protococcarum]
MAQYGDQIDQIISKAKNKKHLDEIINLRKDYIQLQNSFRSVQKQLENEQSLRVQREGRLKFVEKQNENLKRQLNEVISEGVPHMELIQEDRRLAEEDFIVFDSGDDGNSESRQLFQNDPQITEIIAEKELKRVRGQCQKLEEVNESLKEQLKEQSVTLNLRHQYLLESIVQHYEDLFTNVKETSEADKKQQGQELRDLKLKNMKLQTDIKAFRGKNQDLIADISKLDSLVKDLEQKSKPVKIPLGADVQMYLQQLSESNDKIYALMKEDANGQIDHQELVRLLDENQQLFAQLANVTLQRTVKQSRKPLQSRIECDLRNHDKENAIKYKLESEVKILNDLLKRKDQELGQKSILLGKLKSESANLGKEVQKLQQDAQFSKSTSVVNDQNISVSRRYLQTKTTQTELFKESLVSNQHNLQNAIDSLNSQLAQKQREIATLQQQIQQQSNMPGGAHPADARLDLLEFDKMRDQLLDQLDQKTELIENYRLDLQKVQDQLVALQTNSQQLESELQRVSSDLADAQNRLVSREALLAGKEQEIQYLKSQTNQVRVDLEKASMESANFKSDVARLLQENDRLNLLINRASIEQNDLNGVHLSDQEQIKYLESVLKIKEAEKDQIMGNYRKLIVDQQSQSDQLRNLSEQNEKLLKQISDYEEQVATLKDVVSLSKMILKSPE